MSVYVCVNRFCLYSCLSLQTTRSDFDSSEYEVRRRYQDFVWLRSKLEEKHPTLIVHVRISSPGHCSAQLQAAAHYCKACACVSSFIHSHRLQDHFFAFCAVGT